MRTISIRTQIVRSVNAAFSGSRGKPWPKPLGHPDAHPRCPFLADRARVTPLLWAHCRDYTDPATNQSHWSCQMNWHAVAGLAELPGACTACATLTRPDDTDYCKCYEASQGRVPTCAVSGKACAECCTGAGAGRQVIHSAAAAPAVGE